MTTYFLRLEIVRMLRDPKYLALAVGAPSGFYLLFAGLFGGGSTRPGQLPGAVEIMVAMAAYGAIWAVLSTTGSRIAEERQIGWLEQVRAMPLSPMVALGSKVVAALATALPAIVLVCVTAAVVKGVQLSAAQWIGIVVAIWLGSVPFAALGIAIGFCVGSDAAYPLSYGLYMALSALGGLWVPPAILPATMKNVADWLPTYHQAKLGWDIAGGAIPNLVSVLNLIAWTVVLSLLAFAAYRRPRLLGGKRSTARISAATAARESATLASSPTDRLHL
ncbi:ABC transporter permease [Leekyejoonella antrihumi]|uniref:ABC transporter permease n=1 Tax=Leekyejoonella antrihumi TaxID=1660198 RepID=A0A563E324_9MICO|nr:ABC transporter permease [Leekyejoonella antrihumi]TWP36926.1 ABC transporter permease [Leekyejoonella antrihumi]